MWLCRMGRGFGIDSLDLIQLCVTGSLIACRDGYGPELDLKMKIAELKRGGAFAFVLLNFRIQRQKNTSNIFLSVN